jgi:hypothetical protein
MPAWCGIQQWKRGRAEALRRPQPAINGLRESRDTEGLVAVGLIDVVRLKTMIRPRKLPSFEAQPA